MQTLRPYQSDALDRMRTTIRAGRRRLLLVAPTGAGKTTIAAAMIHAAVARSKKVMFLAHRRELISQCSARLREHNIFHGIIQADSPYRNGAAPVQVASVPTLVRRVAKRRYPADLIIVDEAHRSTAPSYTEILAHYPEAIVVGLTATPYRADGKTLGGLYEELVLVAHPDRLVRDGFLIEPTIFAPGTPDVSKVKVKAGDYVPGELAEIMDRGSITGDIVDHWRRIVAGGRTVVFGCTVEHSCHLRDRFLEAGIPAAHLDAETPSQERDGILRRMREGELRVITNVGILTEGWDLPALVACVLARPTKSTGLFLQMCLDAKTEVLTQRGFVGPDDIRDDDWVATMTTDDCAVEWSPVLSRTDRPLAHGEWMYGITSPSLDLRVTEQHTMLFRAKAHQPWRRADASDLAERRSMYEIPISAREPAPGVSLTDAELQFVGWFLSDGSLNPSNNLITIYQAENSPHRAAIEACLVACGFKFGVDVRAYNDAFPSETRRVGYYVSRGAPRGTDKHLRGWADLAPYIDKNLAPALECVTEEQLAVLLEAVHLGDGHKQLGQSWTRRSYHISTGNKTFAERLQSLCVRRGFKCNLAVHTYNTSPLYVLHIKRLTTRHVGGAGYEDRETLRRVDADPGERVWCVETRAGTLIVRRNGKVAIVGNCGRVLRPDPSSGKTRALVLDHAGCVRNHGWPTAPREFSLDGPPRIVDGKGREVTGLAVHVCRQCFASFPRHLSACPQCGLATRGEQDVLREQDGELEQLQKEQVPEPPPPISRLREAYRGLVLTARARGFKLEWAKIRFKEQFGGMWPHRGITAGIEGLYYDRHNDTDRRDHHPRPALEAHAEPAEPAEAPAWD